MLISSRRLAENVRARKLHAEIGALEARLELMQPSSSRWQRERYLRLLGKIRHLKRQLAQPALPFA